MIVWITDNLYWILPFLWSLAIVVYALKLVFPQWDLYTRFGKLESKFSVQFIPTISNKLGWIIFYSFSCCMAPIAVILGPKKSYTGNILLAMHSFRRLLESLFLTKFSDRQMHLVNLGAGLLFYAMAPVTIAQCSLTDRFKGSFIIAAVILNFMQFVTHKELASLPKYSIPKGILFRKVTGPHYTIEILLYLVYFACAPHYLTALMFVFVVFNLTHQSVMTYDWYKNKFGADFTSLGRYKVIPWIF